jgi:ABC-2 type transport system permease protein
VTPYAMALGFGMYVLSAFSGMLGGDSLDVITPFKHFEPNYIVSNAAYHLPYLLLSVVVIVLSIAGSYVLYNRRDIRTAN